jgi:hypothetical protein
MMMILLAAAYLIYFEADKLNHFEIEYGSLCGNGAASANCKVSFQLDASLENPAVYYRLDKFYHNHRSFIRSRDWKQLAGSERTID